LVTAPGGDAGNSGTLAVLNFNNDAALVTVRRSVIAGNIVRALSSTGTAEVFGGGVLNDSLLEMDDVAVSANAALAQGPTARPRGAASGMAPASPGLPCSSRLTTTRCLATALPPVWASRPRVAACIRRLPSP
jgi:hypothetical protein